MAKEYAYIIRGNRRLERIEVTDHENVLPGHVVVQITYTGVCGSDFDAFQSDYAYNPTTSGHEWVGIIFDVGEGITSLAVGDRVVRACLPPCLTCNMCAVDGMSTASTAPSITRRPTLVMAPIHDSSVFPRRS